MTTRRVGRTAIESRAVADALIEALRGLPRRDVPSARAVRREYTRRLRTAEPQLVLAIAQRLVDSGGGIERFVAYELIAHHPSAPTLLTIRRLHSLARELDSWGAVDCFACYLAGPAWREGRIATAAVRRWTKSKNRWWRRAALVSTVPLNNRARGGHGDWRRTLDICNRLTPDRDDMVVKALSWALRELAKRDPRAVRAYLGRHPTDLAPRVRREVESKLRTGLKSPRPTPPTRSGTPASTASTLRRRG